MCYAGLGQCGKVMNCELLKCVKVEIFFKYTPEGAINIPLKSQSTA